MDTVLTMLVVLACAVFLVVPQNTAQAEYDQTYRTF